MLSPCCTVAAPTHHPGEYLFDFRAMNVSVNNQTFLEVRGPPGRDSDFMSPQSSCSFHFTRPGQWYINDYFMGPTGGGNANISGVRWGKAGAIRRLVFILASVSAVLRRRRLEHVWPLGDGR